MICDIRDKYEVVGRNTELTLSALRRAISVTTLDLCNDHVFREALKNNCFFRSISLIRGGGVGIPKLYVKFW